MTIHTTRRLHCVKLAVLGGCTLMTVASGGVLLANRLRDHADFVAAVATFMGALLFGFAWLWWPRLLIKLPRRGATGWSLEEILARKGQSDSAKAELHR